MKVSIPHALRLGQRLLAAQGVPDDIAAAVADHLVGADQAGYASHGLSILPTYCKALQAGLVNGDGRPELMSGTGPQGGGALQAYDGHNGLGQYVGKAVFEQAIATAGQQGQCIFTLRNTHHLGRLGHYGEMAAAAGLVLLAFTNVTNRKPTVAPFGGGAARMTTNPLCIAVPLPDDRPPFVLDMATSAISLNKARVLAATGQPAPAGALIDSQGRPTTDAAVMFEDPPGALLPFGAHKGYALGLAAELLAGVLSGGGTVRKIPAREGATANNLFALLLDPKAIADQAWYLQETAAYIDYLVTCPPQPGVDAVQYPGEYEALSRQANADSVAYEGKNWDGLVQAATELGVADALPE
ncbi:Ldh family oxidoreductase [Bordetella sp. N]|uniref:Ldh family oxidoreductase n=1 Tax=Bordetella sp. N TaxID=1746199 RepID=UPI00070EE127|nr:Ldh family oxidoreductase [Bordetella sp. N]ALM85680.1 lactate dehydrogenase [Bordetella sp. N]